MVTCTSTIKLSNRNELLTADCSTYRFALHIFTLHIQDNMLTALLPLILESIITSAELQFTQQHQLIHSTLIGKWRQWCMKRNMTVLYRIQKITINMACTEQAQHYHNSEFYWIERTTSKWCVLYTWTTGLNHHVQYLCVHLASTLPNH